MSYLQGALGIDRAPHRPWASAALAWAALCALSLSGSFMLQDGSVGADPLTRVLIGHGAFWAMWVALTAGVLRTLEKGASRPDAASRPVVLATLAAGFVGLLAGYYVVFVQPNGAPAEPGAQGPSLDHNAVWYLGANLTLLVVVAAGAFSLHQRRLSYLREAERRTVELENQKLAAALSEARLAALRAQIHPHFLFNALNTIAYLVEARRSEEAYEAISTLAELLRATLQAVERREVRLDEEIALVERMFALARLRFGTRFTWVIAVPAELADRLVPSIVLQPLAENTLVHAVSATNEPVHVEVRAALLGEALVLEVADNGPASLVVADGEGSGLRSLRERLEASGGRLRIDAGERSFRVFVTLPSPGGGA